MALAKRVLGIGEFRQRATEVIKEVETSAQPVVISRHGRPVVEIRPLRGEETGLRGSVTVAPGVDLTEPVSDVVDWEALR